MSTADAYSTNTSAAAPVVTSDPRRLATSIRDLTKEYVLKSETVRALRGVSFDVPEGDYVAIMGPSGSGKSTLLNMLGCLDKPTSGHLFLGEDDIARMTDDQLAEIRSTRIGFVFQSYNLIQQLTVVENIQVPLYYQGRLGAPATAESGRIGRPGGARRPPRPPTESTCPVVSNSVLLSRVAWSTIRSLSWPTNQQVTSTRLRPTRSWRSFDSLNGEGRTIILVTHEDEVAERANRIVRLKDGMLHTDEKVSEDRREAARRRQKAAVEELKNRE